MRFADAAGQRVASRRARDSRLDDSDDPARDARRTRALGELRGRVRAMLAAQVPGERSRARRWIALVTARAFAAAVRLDERVHEAEQRRAAVLLPASR